MRKFTQSICLTRTVEDADEVMSKGDALLQAMSIVMKMTLPEGFEVSSVDAWKMKFDKDGEERRIYED